MVMQAEQDTELYDEEHERALLLVILGAAYVAMLETARRRLSVTVGLELSEIPLTQELLDLALARAAARAALISSTTQASIAALDAAEGDALLAAIEQLYADSWASRAALIAANEAHNGALMSSQDLWQRSGAFDRQLIRDGHDFDEACRERDGTTVAIDTPVYQLHPSCRVSTRPLRPDEGG